MITDKALNKTKIRLLAQSPFLGAVCLGAKHKFSDQVPTAGTDGVNILYNKEFFNGLTKEQRVGLMAHEVWHIAMQHAFRRGNRNPTRYNIAGDHVINNILKSASFELPEGGACDTQYKGKSTEEVYSLLPEDTEQQHQDDEFLDLHDNLSDGDGDSDSPQQSKQSLEQESKEIMAKAAQQLRASKDYGNLPAEIAKMFDTLLNPQVDWKELLSRFVTSKAKDDYTLQRPNRRFLPTYLPSLYSERLGNLVVAIDVSGSIDHELVHQFLSEIHYLRETMHPSKLSILAFDTNIKNTYEYTADDIFNIDEVELAAGGGTDLTCVMDTMEQLETPECLIVLTDGHFNTDLAEPACDTLWLIYNNDEFNQPYGEVAYV